MWGEVPDIITQIKFDVDRFRGFRSLRVYKWGFPLTRRVALTTVLHYRADCDLHGFSGALGLKWGFGGRGEVRGGGQNRERAVAILTL